MVGVVKLLRRGGSSPSVMPSRGGGNCVLRISQELESVIGVILLDWNNKILHKPISAAAPIRD